MSETKFTYELYKDDADEWRWRLVSDNGNIVAASSESYKNYSDIHEMVRKIGPFHEIRIIKESTDGKNFLSEHD